MRFTPFAFAGGQEFLIDYLIVGGGAAGSPIPNAVGGGAGGVISGSLNIFGGNSYDVTIGAGGIVGNINGYTSSINFNNFGIFNAPGGERGKSGNNFNSGSSVICGGIIAEGGGGGSAAIGGNGFCPASPAQDPGDGGVGSFWLDGKCYGGGGGAGNSRAAGIAVGFGGNGGGGNGGYNAVAATNGSGSVGGGGGGQGASTGTAGNGGSGSVIIRYPAPQRAYGGNIIFESGSYVYHTFTSNGTLTT